jgi:hypothetical protein
MAESEFEKLVAAYAEQFDDLPPFAMFGMESDMVEALKEAIETNTLISEPDPRIEIY